MYKSKMKNQLCALHLQCKCIRNLLHIISTFVWEYTFMIVRYSFRIYIPIIVFHATFCFKQFKELQLKVFTFFSIFIVYNV